jgi:hypothetical protein
VGSNGYACGLPAGVYGASSVVIAVENESPGWDFGLELSVPARYFYAISAFFVVNFGRFDLPEAEVPGISRRFCAVFELFRRHFRSNHCRRKSTKSEPRRMRAQVIQITSGTIAPIDPVDEGGPLHHLIHGHQGGAPCVMSGLRSRNAGCDYWRRNCGTCGRL